ncbi:hypothetical protein PLICRDRAFT_57315 [Plicaturopsis crispa FD-325 SS-3]|uniref:Uncharacterized protein n=1 Tax=Plicaturopsis crispa FD-325 SS-3 TaxID=944288 RepID=A0A0C9SY53_PLICR|nr:hypothetical protein PLICRDRAFT_57315 [Plicaturopsis crispa FD-325 SS-3]
MPLPLELLKAETLRSICQDLGAGKNLPRNRGDMIAFLEDVDAQGLDSALVDLLQSEPPRKRPRKSIAKRDPAPLAEEPTGRRVRRPTSKAAAADAAAKPRAVSRQGSNNRPRSHGGHFDGVVVSGRSSKATKLFHSSGKGVGAKSGAGHDSQESTDEEDELASQADGSTSGKPSLGEHDGAEETELEDASDKENFTTNDAMAVVEETPIW